VVNQDSRKARSTTDPKTLLVAFAHPDDEMGCAGTIAAHRARGDRVVLLWLTRGEMTQAFPDLPPDEVAALRVEHGLGAAEILGAEARFLTLPDTQLVATPDAAREVARVIADVRPDGVITWGDAWARGMRHPDHQAAGKIVRDAVTLARLGRVVEPAEPHRAAVPVFTLRGRHSTLPATVVDVTPHLDAVFALQRFYLERVGWPEERWVRERLRAAGEPHGLDAAERFDAWETDGGVGSALF
jgi:N-acetylglucosamine malate deacetylase 1